MPIALNERLIPSTFEEAQEAYLKGRDVVFTTDNKSGVAVSQKYKSQEIHISDWSVLMKAKFFITSYPCQCGMKDYPIVKPSSFGVFELCPSCKGTVRFISGKGENSQ